MYSITPYQIFSNIGAGYGVILSAKCISKISAQILSNSKRMGQTCMTYNPQHKLHAYLNVKLSKAFRSKLRGTVMGTGALKWPRPASELAGFYACKYMRGHE
ncbi:hypothetical protein SETIT_1G091500v2 [Setaria italica]|uniref:Uncharacterized protein n=1 Tax=Setaria italica TaxID=4555 RepID=K3Z1D3_SETIT|nr:hypothetical protein SETIT_1G091500v2 [Setaria italica]